MSQTRSREGLYAHDLSRMCTCGHSAGEHTAVRITKTRDQPCLVDDCECPFFTAVRRKNPPERATRNDEQIAALMERAMAQIQGPGRMGDRKVFIAALWSKMVELDQPGGPTDGFVFDDFKGWLWRNLRTVGEDGRPLYELARADLVAAMDPKMVAASQISVDGVQYHFVIDPTVERARRRQYVGNPAWATEAIADAWEMIAENLPPRWLPKMDHVRGVGAQSITARVKEYGCGAYGCAFPTGDPAIVMKLTTDNTEAEFAAKYANHLVAPVCVEYHAVIRLKAQHQGRQVYLLWRESAEHVGEIAKVLGPAAEDFVSVQHSSAQVGYLSLVRHRHSPRAADATMEWTLRLEEMATQRAVPELNELALGMLKIWREQHIFFGDVHTGNLGMVRRADGTHWVITDPGNIVVVEP